MTIEGINILTQKTIFEPTWYGTAAWVGMMIATFFFVLLWINNHEKWACPASLLCFIFFIVFISLNFASSNETTYNQPSKIEYTIEIIDDNAWKELGPNYTVKEKVYENKEIYIVEGDYVE